MKVEIRKITRKEAKIILKWVYESPYEWYSLTDMHVDELVQNDYYAIQNQKGQIIGFYCFGQCAQISKGKNFGYYHDQTALDIGIGLHPKLCGKGYGEQILVMGMKFAKKKHGYRHFRLTVAQFNQRAIRVYNRIGFIETGAFTCYGTSQSMKFKVMCYEMKRRKRFLLKRSEKRR